MIGTIDHIGIAVNDLGEGLRFYRQALGMELDWTGPIPAEHVKVALLRPLATASDKAASPRIELLEPSSPNSAIAKFMLNRGPGLHHIALRVPDLDEACRDLAEGGAQLLNQPKTGAGGHRYVFVHPHSTGGVLLELVEKEME